MIFSPYTSSINPNKYPNICCSLTRLFHHFSPILYFNVYIWLFVWRELNFLLLHQTSCCWLETKIFPEEPPTIMYLAKTLSGDKVHRCELSLTSLEGMQQERHIAKNRTLNLLVEILCICSVYRVWTCHVFWPFLPWQNRRVVSDSSCPGLTFCNFFYFTKKSLLIKICIAKVPVQEL